MFRGKFVAGYGKLFAGIDWISAARSSTWPSPSASPHSCELCFAKTGSSTAAFGGPSQVLLYLGRYTHR